MTMSRSATGKPGPELVNSFVTSLNCLEMSSRERLKSIAPRGVEPLRLIRSSPSLSAKKRRGVKRNKDSGDFRFSTTAKAKRAREAPFVGESDAALRVKAVKVSR